MSLQYGGAHSVLAVKLDGRESTLTPYYGYVAIDDDGGLVGIRKALRPIYRAAKIFPNHSDASPSSLTSTFTRNGTAIGSTIQGRTLRCRFVMKIALGEKKLRRIRDPRWIYSRRLRRGEAYGYTPYWTYLGNRYDATWTRVAKASENITPEATTVCGVNAAIIKSSPPAYINVAIRMVSLREADR